MPQSFECKRSHLLVVRPSVVQRSYVELQLGGCPSEARVTGNGVLAVYPFKDTGKYVGGLVVATVCVLMQEKEDLPILY